MKRLVFVTLLCALFATAAHAQYPYIKVVNQTNCDISYQVLGYLNSACAYKYSSKVLTVPAASTDYYANPTTVPGGVICSSCTPTSLGVNDILTAITFYTSYTPCHIIPAGTIGASCTGLPPAQTGWPVIVAPNCTKCNSNVTAKWVNPNTVVFY